MVLVGIHERQGEHEYEVEDRVYMQRKKFWKELEKGRANVGRVYELGK